MSRSSVQPAPVRRHFKTAQARPADGESWLVTLDDRPLSTPRRRPFRLPSAALARAIAGEWNALTDRIAPERLPLTALANTAIDLVQGCEENVRAELLAHLDNDLLCYRAPWPETLQRLQAKHWDPPLAALADKLGAGFLVVEGVLPQRQPEKLRWAVAALLAARDAWWLTAVRALAGAAHSLALALAHAECDQSIEAVIAAALLDETFQAEQWGADSEAEARRRALAEDMRSAARFLALVRAA